ncbi:hypothetical protein N0V94_000404 [Neodidymelliopsis sp. IMI 364377]|nr:hypothetical protein N0V94_000404 [Neodidymelliopsis sp. IMI 364377]
MEPQQQATAPHQGRPRTKSNTFSFRSQGSDDSPSSPNSKKHSRKVSDSERRKTHYDPSTKANPNAAMNEAQPIAAALEKPTLQSLRSFQHSDANGNLIAEPDLSNPTRSRWERPLDTIRSFEAAIDGEYRRRASVMRSDQTDVMSNYGGASRRSSYYGGGGPADRYSSNSYYGNQHGRQQAPRDSYDNGYGQGGPVGGPPRVRYGNRMQSDPGWGSQGGRMSNGQNVYGQTPPNGYQQSRDTVHTNGSNGSHSDGAYGTDPNSENSSIERSMPVRPPQNDMGDQYGMNGYGGPIREEYFSNQQQQQQQQFGGAPPPPPHAAKTAPPRVPIKLGGGEGSAEPAGRPAVLRKESSGGDDKRRSWFKRRFSKD